MGPMTMASPNGAQAPDFPQGLLNHTLDEYQGYLSELGKPMYKMNIGELVPQFKAPTSSSSSSSSASITPPLPADCNLNGTVSQKAIHEVLRDITSQEDHGSDERLSTFGEPTLENLLIQSGAMNPGYEGRSESLLAAEPGVQQQHKWIQYDLDSAKQQPSMRFSSLSMFGKTTMNAGFPENQQAGMPLVPVTRANPTTSDSQMLAEINRNEEIVDKSIERRQKRMIKNRESAARSRARKQAYISQLEDKVKKLEDTNMRLKRQMGVSQMYKNQSIFSRLLMGLLVTCSKIYGHKNFSDSPSGLEGFMARPLLIVAWTMILAQRQMSG